MRKADKEQFLARLRQSYSWINTAIVRKVLEDKTAFRYALGMVKNMGALRRRLEKLPTKKRKDRS